MAHNRLIWQLYPRQLLITLAALLAFTWFGTYSIRSFQLQQTASGLQARAHLAESNVRRLLASGDTANLLAFCRVAGKKSATRLTVIAPDGTVLADSDEDPDRMENHSDRPEIISAFAGKIEPSLRFSHTLQANLMYVAIPLADNGKNIGVLRTSVPLTAIEKTLHDIYRQIIWGCLLVALAVALIAWVIARRISKPLEEMKFGAERIANGEFSFKMKEEGSEEVAALARAMNEMAVQLDTRIKTIIHQHNQLQAIFASMVEGVITVNNEEEILDINQAGSQLLDVDPEKIKGRSTQVAIRNTQIQSFVKKALSCAEPVEGEITLVGDDASERQFYAYGTRLLDGTGRSSGALLVINEITKLRKLENIRRDFVANVSHELKTPITSIEGFAETLLDGALADPEDARRFVLIIAKQARRLHAIVEDLLTLSRIEQEAKREEIVLSLLPLTETLRAATQTCRCRAQEKMISINLRYPESLTARINPTLLEQALVNLVDNAVKYSAEGGTITVESEKTETEVLIRVKDTGVGIAQQDLSRIFERFYRVDKARSSKLGGTGLGLSIVKHIVQAHQGKIMVESVPGQGSTFTIHLPA